MRYYLQSSGHRAYDMIDTHKNIFNLKKLFECKLCRPQGQ